MRHAIRGRSYAALAALLVVASMAQAAIVVETVPVGNPGNPNDRDYTPIGRHGQVNYTYNIGKYEVTAGQYTAFLNAVGGVDTYGLYKGSETGSAGMSDTGYSSGIARAGDGTVGNPYTYTVDSRYVNRPINFVGFWEATRFANWLHNGQPTGAQDNSTTEDGAYTLTHLGISRNTIVRNTGWKWAVPTEEEWYKAAYHKNDGVTGNYFFYPTSSDTAPGRDTNDISGNNANYLAGALWSGYPRDGGRTLVGEFENSDSPYGTFDQGGNVMEWNETIPLQDTAQRELRGGSSRYHYVDQTGLQADKRTQTYPDNEFWYVGFRVVQVPEPASLAVLAFGVVGMLIRRRSAGR